jgi:hypothetical protein
LALESISDVYTRTEIKRFAQESFENNIDLLTRSINKPTVRSKLQTNKASFDGIVMLSNLRWDLLAPAGVAFLVAFVYAAVKSSVRGAEKTESNPECYYGIIDKLRRVNEAGRGLYNQCKTGDAPKQHVEERLEQAYCFLLDFTSAIVDGLDQGPLSKSPK